MIAISSKGVHTALRTINHSQNLNKNKQQKNHMNYTKLFFWYCVEYADQRLR